MIVYLPVHRSQRDHILHNVRFQSTVMTLQDSAVQSAPPLVEKPQILNDDQIEQLLQEAEARLLQASRLAVQAAKTPEDQDLIVVENVGKRKPYVCTTQRMRTSTEI